MAPEPRPGLRLGHIPGSINIPWDKVQEGGRCVCCSTAMVWIGSFLSSKLYVVKT
jgi:hypothetical protein